MVGGCCLFPTGMKGVWCASFPIAVVGRAGHCIERFWWSVRGRYQRALSAGVISGRYQPAPAADTAARARNGCVALVAGLRGYVPAARQPRRDLQVPRAGGR